LHVHLHAWEAAWRKAVDFLAELLTRPGSVAPCGLSGRPSS
jgi:hypothetical protein